MNPPIQHKALAIFLKNNVSGQVKTRLAKEVGHERAMQVYDRLCKHTLSVATKVNASVIGFYTNEIEAHPVFDEVHLQQGSGLGERMKNAFEFLLNRYEQVVLIGSDLPDLSAQLLQKAFELLQENDLVLGPALDGGYYLIALRAPQPQLFEDITYSNAHVLKRTLAIAKASHLSVGLLEPLRDLDTFEDLKHFDYLINSDQKTP